MKRLLLIGLGLATVAPVARAAEENFSKAVRAEDFSAAGLAKLSPEELARLDALVRDYKSGASASAEAMADGLAAARREAEVAAQAKAAAEARAVAAEAEARAANATAEARVAKAEADAKAASAVAEMRAATEARTAAEAKAAKAEAESQAARAEATKAKEGFMGGLLAKAKVVLTPGTEVEYTSVDTQLAGDFRGWLPSTVFTLENGQRWQVMDGTSYATRPEPGPRKVRVVPGALGSFFLEIEGVRQKPKIKFVGGGK